MHGGFGKAGGARGGWAESAAADWQVERQENKYGKLGKVQSVE